MSEPEPAERPWIPIAVHGGTGGQVAVTEDMERAVRLLEAAAEAVRSADRVLGNAASLAADAHPVSLPDVAPYVWDAKEQVEDARTGSPGGSRGSKRLDGDMEEMATRLSQVAATFLAAEQQAQQVVGVLPQAWWAVKSWHGTQAWVGRTVAGKVWDMAPLGGLMSAVGWDPIGDAIEPDGPPPTAGYFNGISAGILTTFLKERGLYEPMRSAAASLARIIDHFSGEPALIAVTRADPPAVGPITALGDLGDLLVALDGHHPRGVTVDKVLQADGTYAWIVTIPGTGDTVGANGEVFDIEGNLVAVDGSASDATEMVLLAMEQAGIAAHEPVMLVGHSQGGIVAGTIAVASKATARFNVTTVVTAGTPLAAMDRNPKVQYAEFRNGPDPTWAAGGFDEPPRANETVIAADTRISSDAALAEESHTLIGAHQAQTYAAIMAQAELSESTSLDDFMAASSEFFAGDLEQRVMFEQVHEPPPVALCEPPVAPPGQVRNVPPGPEALGLSPGLTLEDRP
ncbi:hypothetical protein [Demequina sp.]|uniref:PGAP1-like alpha/beta domain-containing protein n=1 Tax=Demequina sp. TaxID=2050685 RepID=UPI003A84E80D